MRNKIIYICLALLVIFQISCSKKTETVYSYNSDTILIPGDDQGISENGSRFDSDESEKMPEPLIEIHPELETLVDVINKNLDSDALDEQIIAVYEKNNPSSTINIKIVEYNQIMKKNNIVWSGPTRSSNITRFDLSVKDLTGDGQMEIICEGLDKDGLLAVDVFKRVPAMGYYEYKTVFSITTKGTVDIIEYQRSEAYSAGVYNKIESYQIIEISPLEQEDSTEYDMRQRTYVWNNDQKKYKVAYTKIIPGKEIKDAELEALLRRGQDDIINFLSCTWRKTDSNIMMFIDKNNQSISLYNGDNIQTYIWDDIYHSNVYQINKIILKKCVNEILRNLRLKIEININSLSELEVVMEDRQISYAASKYIEEYSGNYVKLDPVKDYDLIKSFLKPETPRTPELSGFYRSDTGMEIIFDSPYFSMIKEDEKQNGGFAVYNVGYNVLDLRYFSIGKQQIAKETYRFTYTEENKRGEVIRTLLLEPGTVGVYSFQADDTSTLRFEQIERIELDQE